MDKRKRRARRRVLDRKRRRARGLPHYCRTTLEVPVFQGEEMSERHKTHNGRDVDGRFRVRQADVEDVLEDPVGAQIVRDDVRLGGAVADVGPQAGLHAQHIGEVIAENSENVSKVTGGGRSTSKRRKRGRSR
jgi:hypothetical protein